jgi:L-lactate dehydrogenase complex protein LldG
VEASDEEPRRYPGIDPCKPSEIGSAVTCGTGIRRRSAGQSRGGVRQDPHAYGRRLVTPDSAGDVRACIRRLLEHSRLVCSATPEIGGELDLAAVADPRALADVNHAVVRASCGVAETGSVLLTEQDLQVNALAYLAQHLIVLLDPADIVVNIHCAYARREFRERRYAVFHSGPSATADIEGVLILGAQGVRSLSVLLLPRNSAELDQAQSGQPVQRLV